MRDRPMYRVPRTFPRLLILRITCQTSSYEKPDRHPLPHPSTPKKYGNREAAGGSPISHKMKSDR
jgi:hypothetical protein